MSDRGDLTWRPVEDSVHLFIARAKDLKLPIGSSFQAVIDGFGDHNQEMLDCIEQASPGLSAAMTELLSSEDDDIRNVAFDIANACFKMAKEIWEGASGG